MNIALHELKYLKADQLERLADIVNNFSRSLSCLAEVSRQREIAEMSHQQKKLRGSEKKRLAKLKIQRSIMKRYLSGQSYEQIGLATGYHPKTIYKMIKKYKYDLSILHQIDYDIEKHKIAAAEKMIRNGHKKTEIVKKLNISAHSVVAVAYMQKLYLNI